MNKKKEVRLTTKTVRAGQSPSTLCTRCVRGVPSPRTPCGGDYFKHAQRQPRGLALAQRAVIIIT